jgi:hypothetical protein
VKTKKSQIYSKVHTIPEIEFESQRLTSFAGLVIFQSLFSQLNLKEKLRQCFQHLKAPSYSHFTIVLVLIVHILLGCRKLRELDYYKDDLGVKRTLGLNRLPNVSTISRTLGSFDQQSVDNLRGLNRRTVLERIVEEDLARITMDFDGVVQSTAKHSEGTAVGFNRKKKGARSYYPLFSTIAQSGQVFDLLHRPGNVHDSNGATDFILSSIHEVQAVMPDITVESRMDGAFFSGQTIDALQNLGVEYSMSVPFERLSELKKFIENRKRWRTLAGGVSYFEMNWKPKSWKQPARFVFVRKKNKKVNKNPIQLDLFEPHEWGYDFKVIVTNKSCSAKKVLNFHNGRGSQEKIFAELQSQGQMDYVPVRRLIGNQIYLCSTIIAHNLTRELQMKATPRERGTTEKRSALWNFKGMFTILRSFIQRAGRFTSPQGRLKLTMSLGSEVAQKEFNELLDAAAAPT